MADSENIILATSRNALLMLGFDTNHFPILNKLLNTQYYRYLKFYTFTIYGIYISQCQF